MSDDRYIETMKVYVKIANINSRDPEDGVHKGDWETAVRVVAARYGESVVKSEGERVKEHGATKEHGANE